MKGYLENIEELTLENNNFRKVLYTATNCQLVIMSLKPGEEIGEEIHDVDQFLRVESGIGKTIINGEEQDINNGSAILIPAGVKHNLINTGDEYLKLYTLYTPPEHKEQVIHSTKEVALDDHEDHFDGTTTE